MLAPQLSKVSALTGAMVSTSLTAPRSGQPSTVLLQLDLAGGPEQLSAAWTLTCSVLQHCQGVCVPLPGYGDVLA